MMAALLWALDVNAIAINRIGKEDTFALFFFLAAVWCYERAKRQGKTDLVVAQRWYTASGAAFGLMLASKYFPGTRRLCAVQLRDRSRSRREPARQACATTARWASRF